MNTDTSTSANIARGRTLGLSLSAAALAAIAGFEGYVGSAYRDAVGVPTVGFGATQIAGRAVTMHDKLGPVRAVVTLARDAHEHERRLAACLRGVPFYQHEWDAYVSLAYNVGTAAICRSTLAHYLRQNPPDYAAACAQISRWKYAAGQVLPGLVRRRAAERAACEGRDPHWAATLAAFERGGHP